VIGIWRDKILDLKSFFDVFLVILRMEENSIRKKELIEGLQEILIKPDVSFSVASYITRSLAVVCQLIKSQSTISDHN
jgi:hypothetical protein